MFHDLFYHYPDTGKLVWRHNHKQASDLTVTVKGKRYPAAYIVWWLHYGEPPNGRIRFLDGNPRNLRIGNLITPLPKGVTRSGNRFVARKRVDGKLIHVGSFESIGEAEEALKWIG